MCGIAGFLGGFDRATIVRMADRIAHRGPDDSGILFEPESGLAFGHRRLAIIDLSPLGHQPMASASQRYVICYNGEIYNYRALRRELEARGVRFAGHSDTEVILELFALDGPAAFARLNGIFALAIWDRDDRELTLARDGMGVKPLYITRTPTGFAFASEIKALLELPDLDRTLDPVAAAAYLTYLWSPGARTMLRAVEKLEPGQWLGLRRDGSTREGRFYRLPQYAPQIRDDAAAIAGTADALATAVERQMEADVEVGAFLSGGLDSSAIVAFARRHSGPGRLKCFTIDYAASAAEAAEMVPDLPYARAAARHLDVELHEIKVDASLADDFEQLVYQLDEPQADPAALNSLAISGLAREMGIKVLLSGTGGDDLFSGYRRHLAAKFDGLWDMVPAPVRHALGAGAEALPANFSMSRRLRKLLTATAGSSDDRLARMFEWLPVQAATELLRRSADPAAVQAPLRACLAETAGQPPLERVLRLDQRFFLTDHNLNYADKTGMAHGVEIRVPFLDPDLMAWAATLPGHAKLRGRETKSVLRKAMEPYLPHDIIYRPKTGFGVPLRAWLRTRLRPMMEDLLSQMAIEQRGVFEWAAVAKLKDDTLSGRTDGSYALLGVMAMELWCRRFLDQVAPLPVVKPAA